LRLFSQKGLRTLKQADNTDFTSRSLGFGLPASLQVGLLASLHVGLLTSLQVGLSASLLKDGSVYLQGAPMSKSEIVLHSSDKIHSTLPLGLILYL